MRATLEAMTRGLVVGESLIDIVDGRADHVATLGAAR